ncbi:MAG TPA: AraC family transcriptional regulator ligand-binding domain-containing protein [Fluviicoccus sp.]|nr:AraC family transcriptional regulator ligand-binding domain-containing protein [Fluviicoccus sp.]
MTGLRPPPPGLAFPVHYLDVGETLARALSLDVAAYYAYCGVLYPRPVEPGLTLNAAQILRSNGWIQAHSPPGALPIATFMAHFPVTSHGPMGMLALTAATLGEALQDVLDYAGLLMPVFAIRRHDHGDQVHLVFERLYELGAAGDFTTETVLTAFLQIRPFLNGTATRTPEIHFMHAPLGEPQAYDAAFGVHFRFHCPVNRIVLARQDLALTLLTASPTSHQLMRDTLEQQKRARADRRPTTEAVRRLLREALRGHLLLDAAAIADRLALSPRTLSRRLGEEGSTLPRLRAEVGVEHADWLLRETDRSIAAIAETAGFRDAAAFTRAFRRATGLTPSAVRRDARG